MSEAAMTVRFTLRSTNEVPMQQSRPSARRHRDGQRGQILVVAVLAMISMIGGVALILEGGNAYAHQRMVQNGTDAVANVGATTLAQRLGGATATDAQVGLAMGTLSSSNGLDAFTAFYTDWQGHLLTAGGALAANQSGAAQVGVVGSIPPGAQGVQVGATQAFGTTFGRVIGLSQFAASAEATAVSGALISGGFMPLVFPVNIVDCSISGDTGTGDTNWTISNPGDPPVGQEYIVPLCKTGGGSFMILDLDGTPNNCQDEVTNPPYLQFPGFPIDLNTDNGNNCAGQMVDEVNKKHGQVVLIPICDGDCVTSGGVNATYHIIKVAAFYIDYMSDSNSVTNPQCQGNGTTLVPIRGNGSTSCLVGWFVRYVTTGTVGGGVISGAGAIGVQLIR
jgi:Flp pilus assembly protein TadG